MDKKYLIPAVFVVVFAMFPVFVTNQFYLQFVINMLMFAYLATAWNILGGYAGQMAMGNGVYLGIGAYVSTILLIYYNISPWIGMFVGGLIAGVLSLMLGSITFRLSGSYFAISTVALLHVIRMIFLSNTTIFGFTTNGALGLMVPWQGESFWMMLFRDKVWYYYIILAFLIIGMLISNYVNKSRSGYYLAAISTNQEAAASLGVNVKGMKLQAGFISAFLTAVGGTFYAQVFMVVDPARVLGIDLSVQILLFAIIGGRGTLYGPVIAAFLLVPLDDMLRASLGAQMAGMSLVVYGLVLMLIIYFLPGGIWGTIVKLAGKLTRKKDGDDMDIAEGGQKA